ncbi:hypothetical protein RGUI_3028 [Rhodovulum sp. P5]|nr:hypothetical protein RGUI_3028 [Rhodovulum sp. P5]
MSLGRLSRKVRAQTGDGGGQGPRAPIVNGGADRGARCATRHGAPAPCLRHEAGLSGKSVMHAVGAGGPLPAQTQQRRAQTVRDPQVHVPSPHLP